MTQQPQEQHTDQDTNMSRALAYTRFVGLILRKSRILAYSTEVAESVRHTQPQYVKPLYLLNFAYIGADIAYNTWATQKFGQETMKYKFGDLIVFHTFASFLLPTAFIHTVVKYTRQFCVSRNFSPKIQKRTPLIAGLGMIPFIIHPIDGGVEWVMDNYLRNYFPEDIQKNLLAYHHECQHAEKSE